jgi:hypothetical protein
VSGPGAPGNEHWSDDGAQVRLSIHRSGAVGRAR